MFARLESSRHLSCCNFVRQAGDTRLLASLSIQRMQPLCAPLPRDSWLLTPAPAADSITRFTTSASHTGAHFSRQQCSCTRGSHRWCMQHVQSGSAAIPAQRLLAADAQSGSRSNFRADCHIHLSKARVLHAQPSSACEVCSLLAADIPAQRLLAADASTGSRPSAWTHSWRLLLWTPWWLVQVQLRLCGRLQNSSVRPLPHTPSLSSLIADKCRAQTGCLYCLGAAMIVCTLHKSETQG